MHCGEDNYSIIEENLCLVIRNKEKKIYNISVDIDIYLNIISSKIFANKNIHQKKK